MNLIGITIGDIAGVGPEITLKALDSDTNFLGQYVVYGSTKVLKYYNEKMNIKKPIVEIQEPSQYVKDAINVINVIDIGMNQFEVGKVSPVCGDAAYRYIEKAIDDAMKGKIAAVVTAPLNKEALHLGGHNYDGHTEIFAKLTGTKKYAMMFFGPCKIIHNSTHVSLREACNRVKKERVLTVIQLADEAMKKTGMEHPLIAVAGLNPHSGENGLFGMEEIEEIIPAIEEAKKMNINVCGPIPPDSVFGKAEKGLYDVVLAMYHDQGHIAAKTQHVNECVNVTVGLPIIRTSVDHGTAFDIAGKGLASDINMINSMLAAEKFMNLKE